MCCRRRAVSSAPFFRCFGSCVVCLSFSHVFSYFLLCYLFVVFRSLPVMGTLSSGDRTTFFVRYSELVPFSFVLYVSRAPDFSTRVSFSASPLGEVRKAPGFLTVSRALLKDLPGEIYLSILPSPIVATSRQHVLSSDSTTLTDASGPL